MYMERKVEEVVYQYFIKQYEGTRKVMEETPGLDISNKINQRGMIFS